MLAYVFWHEPQPDVADTDYERRQRSFHAALAENAFPGFAGSSLALVRGLPWRGRYEDWYLVEDWADLGVLNDAAVSGPRREPHDAAAAPAAWGTGGVYRLIRGHAESVRFAFAAWVRKPRGVPYEDFQRDLGGAEDALWQRQLVLGPGSEFCVFGDAPPALAAVDATVTRRLLWPG